MSSILAVTCYTGAKQDSEMTLSMLKGLVDAAKFAECDLTMCVVAQDAGWGVHMPEDSFNFCVRGKNRGFSWGMNEALREGIKKSEKYDYLLCINNDIEFPDRHWLARLLIHTNEQKVLCPMTNFTACDAQRSGGPIHNREPFSVESTPAVLWLIPWETLKDVMGYIGPGCLFREDIGRAWGEDTYTAAVLRKVLSPKPFRIVPSSWVRHLGSKTSSRIPASERMANVRRVKELMKKEGLK